MTNRTRRFLFVATGILVVGLGTGLVASYMGGLQGLTLIGGNGPAELEYVSADARMVAFANVRDVMDSELRQKLMQQLQRAYYTTDDLDTVISDAKNAIKAISCK